MRTRLTLMLSVLIVAACGGTSGTSATDSPTATSQPQASAAAAALQCRLPVAGFVPPGPKGSPNTGDGPDGQPSQKGTGGFFDLATGVYTPAADSDRSYLAAAKAWLPVPPQAIAPDHNSYVEGKVPTGPSIAPPTTTLYVVDIGTKAKRLLFTAPSGDMAIVLGYSAAGVYVETMSSTGPGTADLVLIDPAGGSHRSVAGAQAKAGVYQQAWMAISGDAAWGFALTFPNGQSQPYVDTLMRLDLNDGSTTAWYSSPSPFSVVGFDAAGHPILATPGQSAGQPVTNLAIVSAPNRSAPITPEGGAYLQAQGQGLGDSHGTWFGSADGSLWLYTTAGVFKKVGSVPPQPGGNGVLYDPHASRTIAGPCI